ncbi:MAG: hypothetical protein AABX12_00985 [Nanoarchaeota archaeon]
MFKRGLSVIVTGVLIILLSLVAIGILAIMVRDTTSGLKNAGTDQYTLQFDIPLDSVFVNHTSKNVFFTIKRKTGGGDLQGFFIVLDNNFGTNQKNQSYENTAIRELETLAVRFTHSLAGNVTKITVAPLIRTAGGTQLGTPIREILIDSYGTAGFGDRIPSGGNFSEGNSSASKCGNDIDDDLDGLEDYPIDPGCQNSTDESEANGQNIRNETLFVYTWNLQNNSLSNLIAFPMFGTESLLTTGPYGSGYRTLDVGYMKRAIQEQKARGGKAVIMDWNLWGGGGNVFTNNSKPPFFNHPLDRCRYPNNTFTQFPCMWQGNGTADTAANYTAYFTNLKRELDNEGIQTVDFLILDIEPFFGWWNIRNWPCAGEPNCPNPEPSGLGYQFFQVLQNEPRNNSLFDEIDNLNNMTRLYEQRMPDIWIFGARMLERNALQLNKSIYDTVTSIYPNIDVSNYAYDYNKLISRRWGHRDREYLDGQAHVGTHQAPSLYASNFQNICLNQATDTIEQCNWPNSSAYSDTPFNAFKYDINELRSAKIIAPNVQFSPWISHKTFEGSLIRESDLYQEHLMHIALTKPEYIIGWNPHPWSSSQNETVRATMASNTTDYLLDATMKEIEKLVWFEGRQTLVTELGLASWKADFVLTGMSSAGRKVWRFTPNLDLTNGTGIESTIVSENQGVVVQTANYKITFEDGAAIHRPTNPVSTQGLWIVQNASARNPAITQRRS